MTRTDVAGSRRPPAPVTSARTRTRDALRRAVVVVGVAALGLGLTACGTPPWQTAASASATDGSSPTRSRSVTPSPTAPVVGGDLAGGAASRTLQAGDLRVDVRYWSTVPMDEWTPGSDKPLSMSVTTTGSPSGTTVRLVRAAVDVSYRSRQGGDVAAGGSPAEQASGEGFAVAAPQSWSGTFVIGAAPADAARMRATVTLVLTEAAGGATAQQTATDSLTIDLAPAR